MLSVIVITKNEEGMIRVCLESIKWADEIIVVDNGSTDGTLDIVKKYTDEQSSRASRTKIVKFEGQDFAGLRNKAFEKATGDWVLYVDADERVLEPLKQEVLVLISQNQKSAYALSRKNIIFGQQVNYGPYKKDWVIRLFKRSDFDKWTGKIHETPYFKGKLGYTKNSLLHLTHRGVDQMVLKSLSWSNIDAKLRLDAGHPKMSGWRFIRIFLTETFNQGIVRKGFFNGDIGIMDSFLQAFSMYMTYVRLWEMQQAKPLKEVYDNIDEKLLENNFKF